MAGKTAMTQSDDGARFSFRSAELEVEFRGSEEFVQKQVELVRGTILGLLREQSGPGAGPPPPARGAGTSAGSETAPSGAARTPAAKRSAKSPLEEFYLKAKTREGRGALQDSILLFAWYILDQQGKPEFSIEDLNFCFDLLNIRRPKSLANTLGILKRDRGWLESGSRRGTYTLTTKGRERVGGLGV
jgi:hypothetical protein